MDEDGRGERRGLDEDELRGKWHRRERRAIASLKRGDMDALHFLFVAHSRDVHRVVNAVVRDYHEAEDITQAVFAKLPRAIMRYEERAVPFAAWISRVAKNAALDHVRGRRQTPVEEVRLSESANDNLGRERGKDLLSALSQLPEDQRNVLALRHIVGLAPNEIARRLEKSEPAIHGLHHRGRTAIRQKLSELDAAPRVFPQL